MNQKQITILLVLLVALGAAGLMIYKKGNAERRSGQAALGKKLLENFPLNDVAQITIKQGTNEVNLVKKTDLWRVRERGDYAANYNEISDFLIKAKDLKVLRAEQVGPSQLPRLELVAGSGTNSATVVDFKDQNAKSLASVYLGKKTMEKSTRPSPMGEMGDQSFPNGRFVKLASSDAVSIIAEPLANIEPKPDQWLDKTFFRVEKPKTIAVAYPAETNSWKLTRESETAQWKLADPKPGEELDATKASGVANPFSSASFNDISVGVKPEEVGLDKPTVVTVETFDDFTYTVKVGNRLNDIATISVGVAAQLPKERTPGKDEKPEDKDKLDKEFKEKVKKLEEKLAQEKAFEPWIFQVSGWTVDSLLKIRADLMAEKKEEKPAGADTNAIPGTVITPPEPPK
jgi:hypothetical protein